MAFYHSAGFRTLENEWYEKLERSGFEDIEDRSGHLKSPDTRTIAFQNQDLIRAFFLDLDTLLSHDHQMPKLDRKILELYSDGTKIKEIARICYRSVRKIRNVITRYKGLIDTFNRLSNEEASCRFSTTVSAKSNGASEGANEDRSNPDKAA